MNQNHFVCRVVTSNNEVWFNDGMINNGVSSYEDQLSNMSVQALSKYEHGGAIAMVYTLTDNNE